MAAKSRPHILVLGNHKGGSGKSTLAMHVAIGLLKEGNRVATLDLDFAQRTLTHYIDNRKTWAKEQRLRLDVPNHRSFEEWSPDMTSDGAAVSWLASALTDYEPDHDFIVIDTPGGGGHVSLYAHSLADTLITPVNDSFLDLDVIFNSGVALQAEGPSRYTDTVRRAVEARQAVTHRKIDWLVVRNRQMPLSSRNERDVHEALQAMAKKLGFRTATGLLERVVYREFFPRGLTAFDSLEASLLGVKPSMSHVLARQEVRQLIATLKLASLTGEREPWSPFRQAREPLNASQRDDERPRARDTLLSTRFALSA